MQVWGSKFRVSWTSLALALCGVMAVAGAARAGDENHPAPSSPPVQQSQNTPHDAIPIAESSFEPLGSHAEAPGSVPAANPTLGDPMPHPPASQGQPVTVLSETSAEAIVIPEMSTSPAPVVTVDRPAICLPPGPCPPANPPPDWLPRYKINASVDNCVKNINVTQQVSWTNPTNQATDRVVFHVYPRHRATQSQLEVYERTLESLRLDPNIAFDKKGRRIHFQSIRSGDLPLNFDFDAVVDTKMTVYLPQPVQPGETVQINLDYLLDIPPVQGRFGQYDGITMMVNWYPVVAYYGEEGWDAPPFVGWHQPFFNEAGNFEVELSLPASEQVSATGDLVSEVVEEGGRKRLSYVGCGVRDYSIVFSKRFELHEQQVGDVKIQVRAFPEYRLYARLALQTAAECIDLYSKWFGAYPYKEFKIVQAYFGWNGNESSGQVLIDGRVFAAPQMGHVYIDQLISHEICHQWWYSTVGTDGFRETWVDEGLVVHLNSLRVKQKFGQNGIPVIDWPKYLRWLPNIDYRTLQHYGYQLYYSRGGRGKVLAPLVDVGHMHNVFFLAYDRGSMVFSMMQQRMGDEQFYEFLRYIYAKYQFRILFVKDLKCELEAYTGEDWTQFFDSWLRSGEVCDWKIGPVHQDEVTGGYETKVVIKQKKEIAEPVELGYAVEKKGPICEKVLIQPKLAPYTVGNTRVDRTGDCEWTVTMVTPQKPKQLVLDPDHKVLDVNEFNNRWRFDPVFRLTPLYTPLDEVQIVNGLDRPVIAVGPGIDKDGKIGIRGGLIESGRYRISPYVMNWTQNGVITAGVDAELFNVPWPNFSIGMQLDRTLDKGVTNFPDNQGKLYARWTQAYTTSYIYDNNAYLEAYFKYGQNFYPDNNYRVPNAPPGIEGYEDIRAFGLTYHLDTTMPYWNPERGYKFDATYEHGFVAFCNGETFNRAWSQLSGVHKLPEGLGYLSETRLAGRIAGGVGSPDNGQHFRFGGAYRFRGQHQQTTEGSAYWLTSAEWRYPILTHLDYGCCDNVVSWRQLWSSLFYDVGESYILDDSQGGVQHAIGTGLYFQMNLLSFLEQLTVRFEVAYSIRSSSTLTWFGIYHAF